MDFFCLKCRRLFVGHRPLEHGLSLKRPDGSNRDIACKGKVVPVTAESQSCTVSDYDKKEVPPAKQK